VGYLRGLLDDYDGLHGLNADSADGYTLKIPANRRYADERT
jgi:hypothetical protein